MGATTNDSRGLFPWSNELRNEIKINSVIDKVVRVDITYSKGLNGRLSWYDTAKYQSKKDNDIENDWEGYEIALSDFNKYLLKNEEQEKRVPIDFLTEEEKKKSWHSFKVGEQNVRSLPDGQLPKDFVEAQGDLSYRIFNKTRIKQLLIFPYFTQHGFGSNCIVALSDIIDDSLIFILMAECVGYSYKSSLEEFSTLLRRETIKSAKAAIISRNLSHNLGSHVMFYIKQKLESVGKIMETGALRELINSQSVDEMKKKIENKIALGDEIEMPFLVGLGRFLNYLQERQDFIATVATNYIPYSTVINFKDTIYDELKPEKRYERHKSPETNGKQPANLLLDYIAYSEGFTSSNDIELWFDNFNGNGTPNDVPKDLREFNVALPGGNMGRQAIFSIVENIIRNTAKHDGSKADNGKLRFRFEKFKEEDINKINQIDGYCLREGETNTYNSQDGYCLREGEDDKNNVKPLGLYDKEEKEKPDGERKTVYQKCQNDLCYLGITVELNNSEDDADGAIKALKKGLRRAYITSDGQMDEECKGLKEIRISAAWLRGRELDDEIPSNEPPAVAIRKTEGHLQYIICLPQPKRVAFVKNITAEDFGRLEKQYEYLKIEGCRVFSKEGNVQNMAEYDMVVVEQDIPDKEFKKIQSYVGARVLRCTKEKTMDSILNGSNVVEEAYKNWLHNTLHIDGNASLPVISILDKTDSNVEVAKSIEDNVRKSGTSEKDSSFYKKCIVFNSHYPGQPEKNEEDRILYAQASFVEAISGGNSTDRLIRHDKRDYEWYAKHVIAGKTKVAIFDERIYDMVMPKLDKVKVSDEEKYKIAKKVAEYCENNPDAVFSSKIEFVKDQTKTKDVAVAVKIIKDSGNMQDGFTNVDELTNQIISYKEQKNKGDYTKAWKYRESGIWVFNTKTNEEDKIVQIIGYNAPVEDPIGLYNDKYQAEILATIRMDESARISIEPGINKELNRFDFLTIHQGILDKVYNTLGVMEDYHKCEVTQKLYSCFVKPNSNSIADPDQVIDDFGYRPQFIIHSGRSKPNKKDMPQHLPFLQFSALDHAVRDCKYTLTELLNSSHYE